MVSNVVNSLPAQTSLGWWQATLNAWSQLSDGTQGVIIGALLSGLGAVFVATITTLIANRHARKIQRAQFKFESAERQADSLLQLRRDVYLPAAEALAGLLNVMGRSVNIATSDDDLNDAAHAFNVAIARMQVAGTPETIRRSSQLQRAISTEFLKLICDRLPLRMRQNDIDIAAKLRDDNQRDVERCLELMKAFNLEGATDAARWDAIQALADFATKQRNEHGQEWEKLVGEQRRATMELARSLPGRVLPLAAVSGPILETIRLELGNESGLDVLQLEFERNSQAMKAAMEGALRAIESQIELQNSDEMKESPESPA